MSDQFSGTPVGPSPEAAGSLKAEAARVDRLVQLAWLHALYHGLPRKSRARTLNRILQIAREWERDDNVLDLNSRLEPKGSGELRKASEQLLRSSQVLNRQAVDTRSG